jgi:phage terminase small subunit
MPRISAEARSAAAHRAGGKPPPPPAHLPADAAAVWKEIAASKPPDWFDPGSLGLLENYRRVTVHLRIVLSHIEEQGWLGSSGHIFRADKWKDLLS